MSKTAQTLTSRDAAIIRMVYEYDGCSVEHLRRRFFSTPGDLEVTNLGTLPDGFTSQAFGINNHGQVVGTSQPFGGCDTAVLWAASGAPSDIGDPNEICDVASDINDAGQVVGTSGSQAFRWQNNVMSKLGTLPGTAFSQASAINAEGQVVGWAYGQIGNRAFLWPGSGETIDLNSFLPQDSGWILTVARDINDLGQIVGDGIINGVGHAFLLTPLSTISGNVWIDANGDGAKDSGESDYSNAIITLSGAGSAATTTDASGNYSFTNFPAGSYTVALTVPTGYGSTTPDYINIAIGPSTTVNFGIAPDVSLLAPFTDGITFTVDQGYYNNQGRCNIKKAPDHCDNQLFGLDLVPSQSDNGQILAPVGGTVEFLPATSNAFCLGLTLDDGIHLNLCHFSGNSLGTLKRGDRVTQGQVLGTRSSSSPHVHISLDERRSKGPHIPIPFSGTHALEGMLLNPNHTGHGEEVRYAKQLFLVEIQEWQGCTGISRTRSLDCQK